MSRIVSSVTPPLASVFTRPPISVTAPRNVAGSPPHSVNEDRADFFDVNSDGLPDLLVTDPARYRTADGSPAPLDQRDGAG